MSPKWAFFAHFGDISYNVFNRRKSSYLILKPLNFPYLGGCITTMNLTISNWYLFWIFSIFTKSHLPGLGVTEYSMHKHVNSVYKHVSSMYKCVSSVSVGCWEVLSMPKKTTCWLTCHSMTGPLLSHTITCNVMMVHVFVYGKENK